MCSHSILPIAFGPTIVIIGGRGILGTLCLLEAWAVLFPVISSPTYMTQRPRRRSTTSKSSTNPDQSLRLTESPYNVAEQIVYKNEGNGRERKTYLSRVLYFIQMLL